MQSSTTPDPGYQWENDKLTVDTTNESQEVSPFPAGDHKAHINRRAQRHKPMYNMWPQGGPKELNLNKLGRGPIGDHTNYQGSWPHGFSQEDFSMFSLYKPMYNMWLLWRGHFGPRDITWTNLVEVHLVMLHKKNIKALSLKVSEKKIFHVFPI